MSMSLDKLQKIWVNMNISLISLMFEMEVNKSSTRKRSFKVRRLNPTTPIWTHFHTSFNWGRNVKIIMWFCKKNTKTMPMHCSISFLIFITSGEGYKTLFTFLGHTILFRTSYDKVIFLPILFPCMQRNEEVARRAAENPPVNVATASHLSPGPRSDLGTLTG